MSDTITAMYARVEAERNALRAEVAALRADRDAQAETLRTIASRGCEHGLDGLPEAEECDCSSCLALRALAVPSVDAAAETTRHADGCGYWNTPPDCTCGVAATGETGEAT